MHMLRNATGTGMPEVITGAVYFVDDYQRHPEENTPIRISYQTIKNTGIMRELAIVPKHFTLEKDSCIKRSLGIVHDTEIDYALIETGYPHFDPEIQKDYVLVQKKAFSCNYRDIALMMMMENQFKNDNTPKKTPYAFGSEFSGEVIATGKNVQTLVAGDRVIGDGNYPYAPMPGIPVGLATNQGSKEFEVIHAMKLIKMPASMSFETGAAFSIGAQTSYAMIERLNIIPGKNILITGATSNTALFAINALQNKNVKICALVRNEESKALLQATQTVNAIFITDSTQSNIADNKEVRQYMSVNGLFDYILDPFSDSYLYRVIDLININGKYITCGISNQFKAENREIPVNIFLAKIISKNISVMGNCLGTTRHLQQALDDYDTGNLRIIIGEIITDNIINFFEKTFLSRRCLGKVVFKY